MRVCDFGFNDDNNWQIDCLLFASHLTLNRLSKDKVIQFIHHLMKQGLYDDLMLAIIDDDPLYPIGDYRGLYQNIAKNLALPFPTEEQAKWLVTLDRLSPFLVSPYNYCYFQQNNDCHVYPNFKDFFENWYGIYQDIDGFIPLLYSIDDNLYDFLYRNDYLKPSDSVWIKELETEFFVMAEKWLIRHQSTLTDIFKQLILIEKL